MRRVARRACARAHALGADRPRVRTRSPRRASGPLRALRTYAASIASEDAQLLDGGFLSFSMACSTEKQPGLWRGGNCSKLSRCCATRPAPGRARRRARRTIARSRPPRAAPRSNGSERRSNSMGRRSCTSGSGQTSKPCARCSRKTSLPLLVAKTGQVAVVGPVEELAALVRALPREQVALVVAVEVDLEGLAGGGVALQQLVLDVRLARGRDQRGHPVLGGEDVVDLGAAAERGRASAPSPARGSRLPSWCSSRRGTAWCRRPAR